MNILKCCFQGQVQFQEMYAQMVYKDRKIMELNAKILEQDKRVMDLQEFAGEKDQVIRGRNKVVEVSIFYYLR